MRTRQVIDALVAAVSPRACRPRNRLHRLPVSWNFDFWLNHCGDLLQNKIATDSTDFKSMKSAEFCACFGNACRPYCKVRQTSKITLYSYVNEVKLHNGLSAHSSIAETAGPFFFPVWSAWDREKHLVAAGTPPRTVLDLLDTSLQLQLTVNPHALESLIGDGKMNMVPGTNCK